MGLRAIYKDELEHKLTELIASPAERRRRRKARARSMLYRDNFEPLLKEQIRNVFAEQAIIERLLKFTSLVGGSSFLKRVADEVARPLYACIPQRRVVLPSQPFGALLDPDETGEPDAGDKNESKDSPEQEAWNAIAKEIRIDERMDLAARLLIPHNTVHLFLRYVERRNPPGPAAIPDPALFAGAPDSFSAPPVAPKSAVDPLRPGRLVLDILTPDMLTVIPDPDCPTEALGIGYDRATNQFGTATDVVFWDDAAYFTWSQGKILSYTPHDFGRIPMVEVHRRGRWGSYWDPTTGDDLVNTSLAGMLYDLIVVRKTKSQSHIQLSFNGDPDKLAKDQVSDEESILVSGGSGGQFQTINLESDPSKIIAAKEAIFTEVAANYGISRDRLNQVVREVGEDVALKERVAELARVMGEAERCLFDLARVISREHPDYAGKLPDDARLVVDFGQFTNRVDRKTQLEIRQTERSMGIRSAVDDVLDDNPEFGGSRVLALQYLDEKAAENAIVIARQRALNMPQDATTDAPGQSPQANGALGPKVKAGQISADQAARAAKTGQIPDGLTPVQVEALKAAAETEGYDEDEVLAAATPANKKGLTAFAKSVLATVPSGS
jgi:hypothetical protein